MNIRKSSIIGLLAGLLGMGGLAVAGSRIAGGVYLVLLAGFAFVHAVMLCSRCENDCCALNPTSADFLLGSRRTRAEALEPGDNRWVPFALALTLPFGIYGAWRFSIPGLLVCLAIVAVSFAGYRDRSCRYCPNACPLVPRKP